MFPTQAHPCPHCGALLELRGLRLFVPMACPQCGGQVRALRRIYRFDLLEPLARGAFSMIFLALDTARGETVALKILQPPYGTEEEDIATFVATTRRLTEVEHPHIARIFAVGVEHGLVFVAREWMGQGSLGARITRRGRLPQEEVVEIGVQASSALAAAQDAGLLHRDIEPGNVIFAGPGIIKLTDFGQAVFFDRAADRAGTVWGKFCYVGPERLRHMTEDARSDMYALGATLMHALIGQPPYEGEHNGEILFERLELEPLVLVPKAGLIHPTVAVVLNALLAPDQAKRPRAWHEVVAGFERARASLGKTAEFKSGITRVPIPIVSPSNASTIIAAPLPKAKMSRRGMLVGAIGLLAALAAGAMLYFAEKKMAPASAITASRRMTIAATPAQDASAAWKLILLDPKTPNQPVTGRAKWREQPLTLWLTGSNDGPSGRNDAVAFAARELRGDWTLAARVTELNDGFAGLLVRESAAVDCWMLAITVDATGKAAARVREKIGDGAKTEKTLLGPKQAWLRLARRSGKLAAAHSADGKKWNELGTLQLAQPAPHPLVGFVAHSAKKDGITTATFDQINAPK